MESSEAGKPLLGAPITTSAESGTSLEAAGSSEGSDKANLANKPRIHTKIQKQWLKAKKGPRETSKSKSTKSVSDKDDQDVVEKWDFWVWHGKAPPPGAIKIEDIAPLSRGVA